MMPAHHNSAYAIRRDNMLFALGLPNKLPLGAEREWNDVTVIVGDRSHKWVDANGKPYPVTTITLPKVWLVAAGVANRIQVACPKCGKRMRFSVLQQHAGSKRCKAKAAKVTEAAYDFTRLTAGAV